MKKMRAILEALIPFDYDSFFFFFFSFFNDFFDVFCFVFFFLFLSLCLVLHYSWCYSSYYLSSLLLMVYSVLIVFGDTDRSWLVSISILSNFMNL